MRFSNQVAIVTGAGSGIGEATAYRLSAEGAHVVLVGRRREALESVAAKCASPTTVLPLDVTIKADVDTALPALLAQVGSPSVVVHSAGQTIVGALDELTVEEWDSQFDVNLKSIYLVNKHLWPAMKAGGGSIVMVASTASFAAFPQDAAYVASKGAVLALTKAMALDGASVGIRVNAVCPGFILTPNLQGYFDAQDDPEAVARGAAMSAPLGRMGTPADVAGTISFLASEDAAFVTGASLLVDGGLMAKVPTS
jgi:NAD(P)-dependent dehydrogenase (short-subunit alcohol dehydrogenase family)